MTSIFRELTAIANANASVKYEFTGERGALVSAVKMRGRSIEHSAIKSILNDARLKKKCLITQVWEAPAYVIYMSNKGDIDFGPTVPVFADYMARNS
jgi:hypothetical protein